MLRKMFVVFAFSVVNIFASQTKEIKTPHYIVAVVRAKAEQENNLRSALQKAQQLSRQESTCLQYEVMENNAQPGEFALFEKWTGADDHALQFQRSYIKDFIEQLPALGDVSILIGGHNVEK